MLLILGLFVYFLLYICTFVFDPRVGRYENSKYIHFVVFPLVTFTITLYVCLSYIPTIINYMYNLCLSGFLWLFYIHVITIVASFIKIMFYWSFFINCIHIQVCCKQLVMSLGSLPKETYFKTYRTKTGKCIKRSLLCAKLHSMV